MKHLREHFEKFEAEGTVFGSISQKDFKLLPWFKFDPDVVELFENYSGAFDQKIEECSSNIKDLSRTRDTLLPKLLSGEIRTQAAEKLVEVAV